MRRACIRAAFPIAPGTAARRVRPNLMQVPSPSVQSWARRLLAAEAAKEAGLDSPGTGVMRVTGKLRVSLTQFVGADGFAALMGRALALSRREGLPSLQNARVAADGSLDGIENAPVDTEEDREAAIAITANLLWLLVTFIGEPLTLRLVSETFPAASDRTKAETEDN